MYPDFCRTTLNTGRHQNCAHGCFYIHYQCYMIFCLKPIFYNLLVLLKVFSYWVLTVYFQKMYRGVRYFCHILCTCFHFCMENDMILAPVCRRIRTTLGILLLSIWECKWYLDGTCPWYPECWITILCGVNFLQNITFLINNFEDERLSDFSKKLTWENFRLELK